MVAAAADAATASFILAVMVAVVSVAAGVLVRCGEFEQFVGIVLETLLLCRLARTNAPKLLFLPFFTLPVVRMRSVIIANEIYNPKAMSRASKLTKKSSFLKSSRMEDNQAGQVQSRISYVQLQRERTLKPWIVHSRFNMPQGFFAAPV